MKKILIIGASSAIAQATARMFAKDGDKLFLVARNSEKLKEQADDLRVRGADQVEFFAMDVLEYDKHQSTIELAASKMGGLDLALISHGTLPDQKSCEQSVDEMKKEFETNCISTLSFLTQLANYFEERKAGTIAAISSPAGDRGRQSNYVYGAAKGAVSVFMQGLRNRLFASGVHVLTIKPGFVDTPMTSEFEKGALWASPEITAKQIYFAIEKKKNTAYVPWFWTIIMLIIKLVPETIFKRLKL